MQTVAIKKNGHYIIPMLDSLDIGIDEIPITINDNIIQSSVKKDFSTCKKLETLDKELGGNTLIKSILHGLPEDYRYISSGMTDKEIVAEERAKKYE
jgi:hypothetical protein